MASEKQLSTEEQILGYSRWVYDRRLELEEIGEPQIDSAMSIVERAESAVHVASSHLVANEVVHTVDPDQMHRCRDLLVELLLTESGLIVAEDTNSKLNE